MRFCDVAVLKLIAVMAIGIVEQAHAQDSRTVQEPQFPAVCKVVKAPLRSRSEQPVLNSDMTEDEESAKEAKELQAELDWCEKNMKGGAVRLTLGPDESFNAFLIDPITVPAGGSLIVDGGVTVYGTRNATRYQTNLANVTCGKAGANYPIDGGCNSLITLNADSGIYGYGVIDGQGGRVFTGLSSTISWWDLTMTKGALLQASPKVISTPLGSVTPNITLYKITVRNPPFHTIRLEAQDITIWGVKVQAPWNVYNTDGFDITGNDVTIFDATVANGDQQVAIFAGPNGTQNVTVERFKGYNRAGIAIGINGGGTTIRPVENILVRNAFLTGELPSFFVAPFNGQSARFINGVPEPLMLQKYSAIKSYLQALPNSVEVKGLQIIPNLSQIGSENGPVVNNVNFESVCLRDIATPLNISPKPLANPVINFTPPVVDNIVFRNIHVLPPTPQFVSKIKSQLSAGGGYDFAMVASPQPPNKPEYLNNVTFDNVVFDDAAASVSSASGSSIETVDAEGNQFVTLTNIYPPLLNQLHADYSAPPLKSTKTGNTTLTLNENRYLKTTPTHTPSFAYACPQGRPPFVTGELYLSVDGQHFNGNSLATVREDRNVTLNAVVQPIMSQSTYMSEDTARLAIGSPQLTNPVIFYEQGRPVGEGRLSANGTLARVVLAHIPPGVHTYTAEYPADRFYQRLVFGSVTLQVIANRSGD